LAVLAPLPSRSFMSRGHLIYTEINSSLVNVHGLPWSLG